MFEENVVIPVNEITSIPDNPLDSLSQRDIDGILQDIRPGIEHDSFNITLGTSHTWGNGDDVSPSSHLRFDTTTGVSNSEGINTNQSYIGGLDYYQQNIAYQQFVTTSRDASVRFDVLDDTEEQETPYGDESEGEESGYAEGEHVPTDRDEEEFDGISF